MASTGKIFSDSSNIYQDQARLLFNYYEQAAEQIVKQEEAIEKQISDLEAYRQEIEIKKSDIWKWFLTIIAFFMYFIRKKQYEEQILEIDERIGEKKKEHENIFRDYKVTKMGVAYVPVAQQMAYEDKCFVVDYSGNVPMSHVSLQMSRQNDLLVETMTQMEKLTKEAPIVETSDEPETIDTNDYSLSIQEVNQSDYIGKLDRSIRTISYCMNDTEVKSVDLPLVADHSDFLGFLNEYATSDTAGHPIVKVFDDKKYNSEIDDFCKLNQLKDSLSNDTEQFEDVLKHLMHTMAMSVQTVSAMKLASTDKVVNKSNDCSSKFSRLLTIIIPHCWKQRKSEESRTKSSTILTPFKVTNHSSSEIVPEFATTSLQTSGQQKTTVPPTSHSAYIRFMKKSLHLWYNAS